MKQWGVDSFNSSIGTSKVAVQAGQMKRALTRRFFLINSPEKNSQLHYWALGKDSAELADIRLLKA
jgi:hypothetical protein